MQFLSWPYIEGQSAWGEKTATIGCVCGILIANPFF
jgi:hypothetical protein